MRKLISDWHDAVLVFWLLLAAGLVVLMFIQGFWSLGVFFLIFGGFVAWLRWGV